MALKTYTQEATLSANIVLKLTVTEDSIDTSTNKSNCTATLQLVLTNQARFSASYVDYSLSGDTSASGGGGSASYGEGTHTLLTKTYTKTHGTDGTGSTSVTGHIYVPAFGWNVNITASGALTPIPRYTSITSFTVAKRNETSLTVNWKTADTIDYLWYKYKPSGGSWTDWIGYNTADGTSGSFNVTGLTANTKYYFDLKVRRKDSQLETEWSDTTPNQTTYQYPYVKSIGTSDLNVGASTLTQTFKLYNPLNRSVTVYMKLADNTVINCGSTTNGTDVTYTYTFTTANKNAMNSSITNTTLIKDATYYCTYSSQTVSTVSGKYHIDSSDANYKPTFSTSNWSYATNYVKNDTVVANKSTITVNVNTSATAKTGATITGYTIKWGNQTKTITGTTGSVTVPTDSATTLKVIANDSRGFTTETSRTIPVIAYTDPTCNIDADRTDGVGSDVFLSLDGTYKVVQLYTDSSTQVDNTILSVKYAISTTTNYDNDYTIPLSSITINNGSYSLSDYQIYSDGSSAGFTIGTRYNIRIKVQDRYQTKEFYGTITDGKLAVDCYQDSNGDYHRGINGLGSDDCNQLINGTERVTKALMIPKNSSDGYGLCNSDGMSIIRDHSNQSVTVDATGKTLYLGWRNTTGINILNSAATIDANGNYSGSAAKWNGLEDDSNTANTTSTWIPVYNGDKMQHTLRAIWSSKQHTNYNTHQDYLATLSTLSYWNGAYNSSNASNLTYCYNGEIQCRPTNLYNNTSGATGTVTLSESSANYAYVDIYFLVKAPEGPYKGDVYGCTRVYLPSGKVASLNATWVYNSSSGGTQTVTKQVLINTNKITNKSYSAFNVQNNATCWSGYNNAVYITRVEGYK